MLFTSFHMLRPRNHEDPQRESADTLKSEESTAHGFGTSNREIAWPRACTSEMVSLEVAVMNGFSYVACAS